MAAVRAGQEVQALVALQLGRVLRRAGALQVRGGGTEIPLRDRDAPGHQGRIGDVAALETDVDLLLEQVGRVTASTNCTRSCGCWAMKSGINGARWWRANAGVLLTRNTPLASALAAGLSDASACSSAASALLSALHADSASANSDPPR